MAKEPITLNQYNGTDATGNTVSVVAEDMVTAATIYNKQNNDTDPVILQKVKTGILCSLPDAYVTFTALAYDETTASATSLCTVTPATFTVVEGSKVIFTATAAEGYEFVEWRINDEVVEDATSAVAQLTIPSSDCVIKGIFRAKV